ncbi:hypothetical protein OJF2_29660 [Aquisphaera giovannonii]|uniref:Uncharacterized protein n=1 Tax=Aquisphaera giovannonii TaxID=406548 RepID=A0A5B9W2I4_9BACT|nr:hypothetical protein OJF2_29660 [Aquisphaera giovannonii]
MDHQSLTQRAAFRTTACPIPLSLTLPHQGGGDKKVG